MKSILKPFIPKGILESYHVLRNGRFTCMQWATDGLLTAEIYEEIYDTFRNGIQHDVIEVGGAAGSASIAVGWALKESASQAKLITVEKCEGGTRTEFGDYESNLKRYQRFTRHYGVDNHIKLFPHYLTLQNGSDVLALVETPKVGGLILDADGHIHRDFAIFWTQLVDGAPIIIDDYHPSLSPKHALTYALLNQLKQWELVTEVKLIDTTFFGRRGPDGSFANFDLARCEAIVDRVCAEWEVAFDASGIHSLATV